MNRRSLLKNGLLLAGGLALPPLCGKVACAAGAKWRAFEVRNRIEIRNPSGRIRAWLPLPLYRATDYYRRGVDRWQGNYRSALAVDYDTYGTRMLRVEWDPGTVPWLEVRSQFTARDRRVDLGVKHRVGPAEDRAVLAHFRRPSRLVRTDGIVASTAERIVSGCRTDLDKARAIYEWIVENTFRDPKVKGCGTGDITTMLETGYLGGKCADLNALYVGLARAAGLPAREVYGIRVAKSAEFKSLGRADDITGAQHCRAEVYLAAHGWIPVDPADVRKVVLEENSPGQPLPLDDAKVIQARGKLFGAWEMNWLPYNYASDVRLPGKEGQRVGFLMYPQAATADGLKDCLDPENFHYSIKSVEIV
ncbi:transglutaminase family protein [Methylococcus sp. EFPC2]|uniref:transglutaminase-like domain-containing protein n=1 Tax=Methylococcus sp. EFPC2 TaxID=2812648 RepID=UPI0019671A4B|nr:transglutaminase domain-containing protein [Methylococcus sp. EFPC2]QSA96500.1 transglutaminase domain-containing protein [Methylococcus sp. EFPC2]